jgi:hypothetical protein
MPVDPTVRTRKNVPINSVAYFFIFCPPSEGAYYHDWIVTVKNNRTLSRVAVDCIASKTSARSSGQNSPS